MKDEKEYYSGYLPKDVVTKLKLLEETSITEKVIEEMIVNSKDEYKTSIEELDLDLQNYKVMLLKTRAEVKKTRDELLDAEYALWDGFYKEKTELRNKIDSIVKEYEPLKKEIKNLNDELKSINTWKAQDLIEVMQKLDSCYTSVNSNMVKFIIDNYKTGE